MKTPWNTFCIIMLLNCAIPAVVRAQFNYTINADLTITITGYTGAGGAATIPDTINGLPVTSIGENAFRSQVLMTSITILNNVTNIGSGAFAYCGNLTNVSMGSSVISIGQWAFAYCSSLISITIPPKVVRIEDYTFAYCAGLTNLAIPQAITNIGPQGFENLISLQAINVEGANEYYSSVNGVLFDKSQSTLIRYPAAKAGSYLIPNSVSSIRSTAFQGCTYLTNLTTGNSVTNIGDSAFQSCSGLANASFPDALSSIGSNAFYSCVSLRSFTIRDNVINIGSAAFFNCVGLTNLTIGSGVTNIGDMTFVSCANLTRVTLPESVKSIGFASFELCTSLTSVTVGRGVSLLQPIPFDSCPALAAIYFLGNAPVVPLGSGGSFPDISIIYYVPGTIGWSSPFAGRPALPIAMQIQTADANFGVRTNQFGFHITGSYGLTFFVEASTNLVKPSWSPLLTNTLTTTAFYFSDPQWTNYPSRYYRLRWP